MAERKCGVCRQPGHTARRGVCYVQAAETQAQRVEMDLRREGGAAAELLRAEVGDAETVVNSIVDGRGVPEEEPVHTYVDPDMPIPADAWGAPDASVPHAHTFQYGDDNHGHSGSYCECGMEEPGGFTEPRPIYTGEKPGPWFSAQFPGICEKGGEGFDSGDEIRADGQGGYECRDCVQAVEAAENPPSAPPAWDRPTAANVKLPMAEPGPAPMLLVQAARVPSMPPEHLATTAAEEEILDAFAAPAPVKHREAGPTRTDRNGHRLKDPVLGDFRRYKNGNIKSVRRVTTFNDVIESKANLDDWKKRNVILGAAARPDIVAMAHGKDIAGDKTLLNALVAQLEEVAGSKKAASTGTLIHKIVEQYDAGELTMEQIPPAYRPLVTLYRDALRVHGLRVVPGMQELTTFVEEWGGVSGSFDKVYEVIATGEHVVGDVKTGKTMEFGWGKIECQLSLYAHGYNRHGDYDWDAEEWRPPRVRVSLETGIVIHLPVEGERVGGCGVLVADLTRGWRYAAVCGAVFEQRSQGAKPLPYGLLTPVEAPGPSAWEKRFSVVESVGEAGALWVLAKDDGVEPMELKRLVTLAQDRLRALGING